VSNGLLSSKKLEQFKQALQGRIAEFEHVLANAERETRASSARHADPTDQASAEYERQTLAHKADVARQTIKSLTDAVKRIDQGGFGECAQCENQNGWKQFRGRCTASNVKKRGTFARIPPHNRAHGGIGFQRRGIDAHRLALQQPFSPTNSNTQRNTA
jgi:RNA polymerase-binding transcription factor DksA